MSGFASDARRRGGAAYCLTDGDWLERSKVNAVLEKINTQGFEAVSRPSKDAITVLNRVKASTAGPIVAAEVGVGVGATTVELVRTLDGSGELHLFDRETQVRELVVDLEAMAISSGVTLVPHGNGWKTYDSYAWVLATMARDLERAGQPVELFDFVYLDGAHAFHHDAPACAVLKRMIKPGGYLVLDDMKWTFNTSPTMNPAKRPEVGESYTEEQLSVPHVALVVDVLLRPDKEFEEIFLTERKNPSRAVFRRVPAGRRRPRGMRRRKA